jgi:uncharacterized protein YmfQ (DUF2313 family)
MDLISRYREMMKSLLPFGMAWTRDALSTLHQLLDGLSVEFSRIHERADDLLAEMEPTGTIELLSEWESVWGLPNQCTGALSTLDERRAALLAKMIHVGQQTPGFFVRVAATLGYTIVVEENIDGDPYVWRIVSGIITTPVYARAGSARAGDQIRTWGGEMLECAMRALNPAHLEVLFAYIEADVQPALESATIWDDGQTLAMVFNRALSHGSGYADSDFNLAASVSGGLSIAYLSGNGTATHLYTIDGQILNYEIVTLQFSGGSQSLVRVDDVYLEPISSMDVKNNSEQTEPLPTIETATIDETGNVLTLVFSEAMSLGASYQDSDFKLDTVSWGTDIGVTYSEGSGTDTWTFTIAKTIRAEEAVDLDYSGRTDGIEDSSGNDLSAVSDMTVFNGSTEDYSDIILWSGFDGSISGSVYTATPNDYPASHTGTVQGAPALSTLIKRVGWSALHRPSTSPLPYVQFAIPSTIPIRIGVWHYASNSYNNYPFWLRSSGNSLSYVRLFLYYSASLRLTGTLGSNITLQTVTESFPTETWRFFEMIFDPPNRKIKIFVNGELKIDYTHGSDFPTINPIDSIRIGDYNTIGPVDYSDNLIISNDITRDLYALAMLEACPRI